MTKDVNALDLINDRVYRGNYAVDVWPDKFAIIIDAGHVKTVSEFCKKHKIDITIMSRVLSCKRLPSKKYFEKVNAAIASYIGDDEYCG